MKRMFSLLFAVLLLCMIPLSASAHDYVQLDKEGSITLELQFEGEPVIGGKFSCVKVADVVEENGNYYFKTLLEGKVYREDPPSLEDIQELVTSNRTFFREQKLTVANKTGTITFESRLPGLYFITQDTEAQGYSLMNDFLVSLPYMDDGTYIYEVTAKTKSALEPTEIETEPEGDKDDKLPQTGQLKWPVPALVMGGLAIFTLGWYLRFGKKNEEYET